MLKSKMMQYSSTDGTTALRYHRAFKRVKALFPPANQVRGTRNENIKYNMKKRGNIGQNKNDPGAAGT
jgi:hypothetical protein